MGAATLALALLLLATPAWAETLLHLSQTATVMITPDELDATLRAEAVSANPADAQSRVNALMAKALIQARKEPDVTVSTGGYTVWHMGPTPQDRSERWQASQSLALKSHDATVLLKLVGSLQQEGLATSQLDWRLSRAAERKAHAEATRHAISALRARIDEAAALLGLRFGSFKDVRLGAPTPPPVPRMLAMAAPAMAAATPPQAVAAEVPVNATVEADAILLPR